MIWETLTAITRLVELGLPLLFWTVLIVGAAVWVKEKLVRKD